MGKILVLTEKPSVGRDIAKVLNCRQKGSGCLIGDKYLVTWALGHLVTLAEPEAYGEKYKSWRIEDLPMLPSKMSLIVIRQTSKQFNNVKNLLNRNNIDELVIATDSGREGELVARWILEKAGFRKTVKRLWISSQTDKSIRDGFKNLKSSSEYDNLYKSAKCRAEADWLVGLNITRALTCKHNAQLSAGRVQTPTLAMIVDREDEIRKFVPVDYWTVDAKVNGFSIQWKDKKNGQTRIWDKARADSLVSGISNKTGEIIEVNKKSKQEQPPLAYDLTELQRDANRRFGYSAKKTLSIMQKLYEEHKLLTYPRTDSRYITSDVALTLADRLKSIAIGPYAEASRAILKGKINAGNRLVNNSKVTDHHAIIPTEQYVDLGALSAEERKIYDLVIKRFLAVLMQPYEYQQTTVKMAVNNEEFTAKGKIVKSKGWKVIYEKSGEFDDIEDGEDKNQSLPEVQKGDKLKILSVQIRSSKTKPPARYTEATLLSAMEHPGKFVDDKTLKDTLESVSGLGTPATRADIIEKLFDSFYMERRGNEIIPTSKGKQLIGLVPPEIKSPELTAKWEQQLKQISIGKQNPEAFIKDMKAYASKLVSRVIAGTDVYRHDNLTREECPDCGKYLLNVTGKKGKMLVCQDRECSYRKHVSQVSNARCPECHKKMEIRGENENKSFYCICGYREKLDAFKKRKGEKVNKKEVQKYIKRQDKEENINSALADALSKWKK